MQRNCADLPIAPAKIPIAAHVSTHPPNAPDTALPAMSRYQMYLCTYKQDNRSQESEIANTRHDKSFFSCIRRGRLVEPEAD